MTIISVAFITGFSFGFEFPPKDPEYEVPFLVIDLGILRVMFEKVNVE